ncbi:GGDEF domain-containing protein [Brucepastera parasyntrophica]|uniref:sensor domain-containing diguanylate cyclase n=1 Tax=Brucepastera parasyntrophica TaxID=2880008 RepID=UPI00210B24AC|nr:GGDEF domain-containing protein [Brucepastera parasyntrophica]ULQ58592.1 GGDEF domain-containing protein [Brucepastera parasyntrophica]
MILPQIKINAYNDLNEKVYTRKDFIESEMKNRWSNFDESIPIMLRKVNGILYKQGKPVNAIEYDDDLNNRILEELTPEVIYLLRKNNVTGAFFILNQQRVINDGGLLQCPGIYLRDHDPSTILNNNEDIVMERGNAAILKQYNLSLDTGWMANFQFTGDGAVNEEFYFAPVNAAKNTNDWNPGNLGFWSSRFKLAGDMQAIVTYSIPLIHESGYVYGVLGVDVTVNYLRKFLKYEELGANKSGAYVLAVTDEQLSNFERICINTFSHEINQKKNFLFELKKHVYQNIFSFASGDEILYGSIQPVKLYSANSPFNNQKWVLIGLMNTTELFRFSRWIQLTVFIAMIISLICCFLIIVFASKNVTRPIQVVLDNLKTVDPYDNVILERTRISEIDDLTQSIEDLSKAVADSASIFSKIIDMTGAPIAVFEIHEWNDTVYCSSNIFKIVDYFFSAPHGLPSSSMKKDDFYRKINELEEYLVSFKENRKIYKITKTMNGQPKWLQIVNLEDSGRIFGTITDISNEMKERQKIAYERDYDQLTGILNSRGFRSYIDDQFLKEADVEKISALLMFDLDNLKRVNDTYGHELGDTYILCFAEGLRLFEQYNATIARRSGDEFYVILLNHENKNSIRGIVRYVFKKILERSIILPDGTLFPLSASGGLAWFPGDEKMITEWVHYADFAMYSAKRTKKGSFQEFNEKEYLKNIQESKTDSRSSRQDTVL